MNYYVTYEPFFALDEKKYLFPEVIASIFDTINGKWSTTDIESTSVRLDTIASVMFKWFSHSRWQSTVDGRCFLLFAATQDCTAFGNDNNDENNSKENVSRYYNSERSAKQVRLAIGVQIWASTLSAIGHGTEHPYISSNKPGKAEDIHDDEDQKENDNEPSCYHLIVLLIDHTRIKRGKNADQYLEEHDSSVHN